MSKDFKEKFERVCALKDRMIGLIEAQVNGNIESVDAKELGEVADISKDMCEIMKLCCEAEYYHKITEAMEKNSDEENMFFMEKYAPESRTYTGGYARGMGGRRMYHDDMMYIPDTIRDRMYYTNPNTNSDNGRMRDYREGRSGMSRRTYMEIKDNGLDKAEQQKELEHYLKDLSEDITEMMGTMDANDRAIVKQKLTTLASKIQ